jgi:FemAB-related protein (PEP-CTERM system-associated)
MTYQIKELTEKTRDAWDHFVDASPAATFFHRSGWRPVLQDSFGHQPCHHYVEQNGRICGILPLFHIESRLFGNRLTSTPFCVVGSPVSESMAIDDMLDRKAVGLFDKLGADYIEYRDTNWHRDGWVKQSDLYATFLGEMEVGADRQLERIPRKQRAVLRKALRMETMTWTLDEDTEDLYALYALSVRNLGTPVFPKRYFRNLKQEFADACEVLTVRFQGRPVSSVLTFYFRDRAMPYYTGSRPEARTLGANDLMYWQVMRRAAERGCKFFDFGRSKVGTGAYHFKRNWGFEPRSVTHQYYLRDGHDIPAVNPTNPKYRAFIALWRRLPLPVTKALGPYLVKGAG